MKKSKKYVYALILGALTPVFILGLTSSIEPLARDNVLYFIPIISVIWCIGLKHVVKNKMKSQIPSLWWLLVFVLSVVSMKPVLVIVVLWRSCLFLYTGIDWIVYTIIALVSFAGCLFFRAIKGAIIEFLDGDLNHTDVPTFYTAPFLTMQNSEEASKYEK